MKGNNVSKPWTEKLAPSEVAYANSIIEQIPEDHGARAAFINILQKLSESGSEPKFRYFIASIFRGDVRGTNDETIARQSSDSEDDFVIDALTSTWLITEDKSADADIQECK
jgi:hypothetical protein